MTDYESMAAIIRGRMASWTTTVIDWSAFNAPEDEDMPTDAAWVRPVLQGGETFRVSLGPVARRRNVGVLVVQVFVPLGSGDNTLRDYMDQLGELFRDYQSGGVQFRTPDYRTIGRDPEGPWYFGNVTIPYRWDQIV